jgi:integrase
VRCTPKNNKARTIADYKRLISRHFSHLDAKRIAQIGHLEISRILDELADTPSEANHAYISIKTLFNFAMERKLAAANPCPSGLPYKRGSRDRVLADPDLVAIWSAATEYPFGAIVRLLILTGQRRTEIGALQWTYIHDDLLTLPSAVTKNGVEHTIPLTRLTQEILNSLPKLTAFVFPSKVSGGTHFSGWNKCKQRLPVDIPHWTLHDIRRTFSTIHARIGTPPHITEHILNHQVGTLTPIAKIYNRYSYLDEMREAMCNYEQELVRIFSIEKT